MTEEVDRLITKLYIAGQTLREAHERKAAPTVCDAALAAREEVLAACEAAFFDILKSIDGDHIESQVYRNATELFGAVLDAERIKVIATLQRSFFNVNVDSSFGEDVFEEAVLVAYATLHLLLGGSHADLSSEAFPGRRGFVFRRELGIVGSIYALAGSPRRPGCGSNPFRRELNRNQASRPLDVLDNVAGLSEEEASDDLQRRLVREHLTEVLEKRSPFCRLLSIRELVIRLRLGLPAVTPGRIGFEGSASVRATVTACGFQFRPVLRRAKQYRIALDDRRDQFKITEVARLLDMSESAVVASHKRGLAQFRLFVEKV